MPGGHGGFVAGTLVHARGGMVPIENIRVGDLVLSTPRSGEGAPDYKPVLRVIESNDRAVIYVAYEPTAWTEGVDLGGQFVIVTPDHPFWVAGAVDWAEGMVDPDLFQSWVSAHYLEPGNLVLLSDNQKAMVTYVKVVQQTATPRVGWMRYSNEHNDGNTVDFRGAIPVGFPDHGRGCVNHPDLVFNKFVDDKRYEDTFYQSKVYNLEVQDFNAYFVDHMGVWVSG